MATMRAVTVGSGALALGQMICASPATVPPFTLIAPNATATNKWLRQVSGGAPTWEVIAAGDLPTHTHVIADVIAAAGQRLFGRSMSGSGAGQEITLAGGLEFGTTFIRRSALTGDVTAPVGSNATTIANAAVTLAKLANLATQRLIGRNTAGTGVPEAVTVAQALAWLGDTRGMLLRRGASAWEALALGASGQVLSSDGTDAVWAAASGIGVNGFRLTLTSGTAVTTADVGPTSATTLYLTPHTHNQIALYDGSMWSLLESAEVSLSTVGMTDAVPHDIFAYDNSGTLTLEYLAWTNTTTRATALVRQDGVWCKSGALTRRYVGTVVPNDNAGDLELEDSLDNRLVFNADNRVPRPLRKHENGATFSWTYTANAWQSANANDANRVNVVIGLSEEPVKAHVRGMASQTSVGQWCRVGVGVDSASANSAQLLGDQASFLVAIEAWYEGWPGVGFHYLQWLESSSSTGTCTWYGDTGSPTEFRAGIRGEIMA